MQEPSLQAGRSVAERSSELVRSLAPRYEKVLQEVYKTGRDNARLRACLRVSLWSRQRVQATADRPDPGLKRDFQSPAPRADYAGTAGSKHGPAITEIKHLTFAVDLT
jgi:hypothetical protein